MRQSENRQYQDDNFAPGHDHTSRGNPESGPNIRIETSGSLEADEQLERLLAETFLSRKQLALRWGLDPKTLANWKSLGRKAIIRPRIICGRLVRYAMSDIVEAERSFGRPAKINE